MLILLLLLLRWQSVWEEEAVEVSKEKEKEEEWSLQEEVDFSGMVVARPHHHGTSDRSRSRT